MGNPLQSIPINAAPFVRLELFLFHHAVHPLRSLFFHYEPPPFPNLDSIPSQRKDLYVFLIEFAAHFLFHMREPLCDSARECLPVSSYLHVFNSAVD